MEVVWLQVLEYHSNSSKWSWSKGTRLDCILEVVCGDRSQRELGLFARSFSEMFMKLIKPVVYF